MVSVDWLAILIASAASFALGALWYSPLMFLKPWLRATGQSSQPGHGASTYLTSAILTLASVYALAVFIPSGRSPLFAAHIGLLTGLLIVAASIGINNRFALEPLSKWAIDGGYHVARLTLAAAIYAQLAAV